MENSKQDTPLYFYHLVNKNVDISSGLISLQYMYDNGLFELFDKNVDKYKTRILNDWNLKEYNNKKQLTRNDYIDALNSFRGKYGSRYIYFFRYPPYKELGSKMEEILKYKDIYRININDKKLKNIIVDIFYGYDMSNSDNKKLDKSYYECVTREEYFKDYDDSLEMNFAKLNHIGVAFSSNKCPFEFLEKVN